MPNKHCAYGTCNSDSRYYHKPHMKGVFFLHIPGKLREREKCMRWVKACGRPDFTYNKVTFDSYICSKHFHGGHPSAEYPDPIPATASEYQVLRSRRPHKKRLKPKQDKEFDPAVPKFLIFDELQLIPSEEEDEQQKKRLLKMAEGEAASTGVKLALDTDLPRFNGGIKVESG